MLLDPLLPLDAGMVLKSQSTNTTVAYEYSCLTAVIRSLSFFIVVVHDLAV